MPLPTALVYNDLNGSEIKEILRQRFVLLLDTVPFLQKHLTLPRVSMSLLVHLDQWADQGTPERLEIIDSVTLENHVSAAPTPDGHPPDQVRDDHGLPIPTPAHGDRGIGAHPFIFGRIATEPRGGDWRTENPLPSAGFFPYVAKGGGPEYTEQVRYSSPSGALSDAQPLGSGGPTSKIAAPAPFIPDLPATVLSHGLPNEGVPVPAWNPRGPVRLSPAVPDPFVHTTTAVHPADTAVPFTPNVAGIFGSAPEPNASRGLDGRSVEEVAGVSIDRTGQGGLTSAGLAKMHGATVVNLDQGPAGLRQGGERGSLGIFKNQRSR